MRHTVEVGRPKVAAALPVYGLIFCLRRAVAGHKRTQLLKSCLLFKPNPVHDYLQGGVSVHVTLCIAAFSLLLLVTREKASQATAVRSISD